MKKRTVRTVLSALAIGIGLIAALVLHVQGAVFMEPPMLCSAALVLLGFINFLGGWRWTLAVALVVAYLMLIFLRADWLDTLAIGGLKALATPWLLIPVILTLVSDKKKRAPEDDRMPKSPFPEDAGEKPVRSLTVKTLWDTEYQLFRGGGTTCTSCG